MTQFEILSLLLTVVAIILIPICALIIRITIKWVRIESRLSTVAEDLTDLVRDKDKIHSEIVNQMREDRAATNRRLEFLERNVWTRHA